jgi:hypothetical protein
VPPLPSWLAEPFWERFEATADTTSATTIRIRCDKRIRLGVFAGLKQIALESYDRITGLVVDQLLRFYSSPSSDGGGRSQVRAADGDDLAGDVVVGQEEEGQVAGARAATTGAWRRKSTVVRMSSADSPVRGAGAADTARGDEHLVDVSCPVEDFGEVLLVSAVTGNVQHGVLGILSQARAVHPGEGGLQPVGVARACLEL